MPTLKFLVTVDLEKTTGKFVSKEDLAAELLSSLEGADPGSVQVDESEYEVTGWTVDEG